MEFGQLHTSTLLFLRKEWSL